MSDDYRVLVTGSRDLTDSHLVHEQLGHALLTAVATRRRMVVVHGACPRGADKFAHAWAKRKQRDGLPVEVEAHPAKNHPTQDFGPWPGCGPKRNNYMVSLGADLCLAFIGLCTSDRCVQASAHGSHGSSGCLAAAKAAGIRVVRWDLWLES